MKPVERWNNSTIVVLQSPERCVSILYSTFLIDRVYTCQTQCHATSCISTSCVRWDVWCTAETYVTFYFNQLNLRISRDSSTVDKSLNRWLTNSINPLIDCKALGSFYEAPNQSDVKTQVNAFDLRQFQLLLFFAFFQDFHEHSNTGTADILRGICYFNSYFREDYSNNNNITTTLRHNEGSSILPGREKSGSSSN